MRKSSTTDVVTVVVAAMLWGGSAAHAMDSCAGTYAATLLGELPRPLIVKIDVTDDSPRNLALAERFKAGLRDSGIAVTGAPTASVQLNASLSGGPGDAGAGSFSDFSDFNAGGVQRDYPDASRLGGNRGPVGTQTLTLRIDLTPNTARSAVWVGSVQCTVKTSDTGQIAYDLGTVIGPVIGKRSERIRF